MGLCASCFGEPDTYEESKPTTDYVRQPEPVRQPDPDERRRQMLEAAEKRQREQEAKGLQNPERVKAKQKRLEELEKKQEQVGGYENQGGGLRWQVN